MLVAQSGRFGASVCSAGVEPKASHKLSKQKALWSQITLFNMESKPAPGQALPLVFTQMQSHLPRATKHEASNADCGPKHAHATGGITGTLLCYDLSHALDSIWPLSLLRCTQCIWKQEVVTFGSPSLSTGCHWVQVAV